MTGLVARMEDVVLLLEDLQILAVEEPRTILGRLTYGLDKDEIQMQISKIKATLPADLKNASNNIRQSEEIKRCASEMAQQTVANAEAEAQKIIDQARAEAARLIEEAQLKQERMVAESEILRLTKAQSEEIRNEAERVSKQIRSGADQYAADLLARLEANVDRVASSIKASRAELGAVESVSMAGTNRPAERIRV